MTLADTKTKECGAYLPRVCLRKCLELNANKLWGLFIVHYLSLALASNQRGSVHEVMQLVIMLLFALVLFAILMSKGNRRSHSYFNRYTVWFSCIKTASFWPNLGCNVSVHQSGITNIKRSPVTWENNFITLTVNAPSAVYHRANVSKGTGGGHCRVNKSPAGQWALLRAASRRPDWV